MAATTAGARRPCLGHHAALADQGERMDATTTSRVRRVGARATHPSPLVAERSVTEHLVLRDPPAARKSYHPSSVARVACQHVREWQDHLVGEVSRVVGRYGFDGVFLDQPGYGAAASGSSSNTSMSCTGSVTVILTRPADASPGRRVPASSEVARTTVGRGAPRS